MIFHRMKEIATYLMEVAEDTGYAYEFLCDRVSELVEDGQNYNSAVTEVGEIAYELDY